MCGQIIYLFLILKEHVVLKAPIYIDQSLSWMLCEPANTPFFLTKVKSKSLVQLAISPSPLTYLWAVNSA